MSPGASGTALPDPGRAEQDQLQKTKERKSRKPTTYPQRRSYTQRINDGSIFGEHGGSNFSALQHSRTARPRTCVSNPMLLVSLQLATSRFSMLAMRTPCGKSPWLGYAMAKSPRRFRLSWLRWRRIRDSGLGAYPVNQGLCLTAGRRVSLNQVVDLI